MDKNFTITLFYGSVRDERKGIKAAKFLEQQLSDRGHYVHFIDPLQYPLPFLNKMYKEYPKEKAPENMELIAEKLRDSDGILIVTGEYNHGLPPALKNLLDHFQSEYFFKPSAIAAYSAGSFGGMRAAVHLRAVTGELGMPSISSMLPFPRIGSAFDDKNQPVNEKTLKSSKKFIDEFEWYMEALKKQRSKGTPY